MSSRLSKQALVAPLFPVTYLHILFAQKPRRSHRRLAHTCGNNLRCARAQRPSTLIRKSWSDCRGLSSLLALRAVQTTGSLRKKCKATYVGAIRDAANYWRGERVLFFRFCSTYEKFSRFAYKKTVFAQRYTFGRPFFQKWVVAFIFQFSIYTFINICNMKVFSIFHSK